MKIATVNEIGRMLLTSDQMSNCARASHAHIAGMLRYFLMDLLSIWLIWLFNHNLFQVGGKLNLKC